MLDVSLKKPMGVAYIIYIRPARPITTTTENML